MYHCNINILRMDRTTLNVINWKGDMIAGNNVSKVTVRSLHMTRSSPGAMQGFDTEVRKGEIVLDMPPGKVFSTSLLKTFLFIYS